SISSAKNELIGPAAYEDRAADFWQRQVSRVYQLYQQKLVQNNGMDFDDLLMQAVHLFRTHPDVLKTYQDRFRYVLVDEYQDTNHAQYVLVSLLVARHGNLCVVGDDDQSIYGWRGADIRNILDFEKDFPDAVTIRLEQNYRSTGRILEAANHVIAQNVRRKGKTLRTDSGAGDLITVVEAADEDDEADWIAAEILARLRDEPERTLRDFVVLYRTNAQSRALEDVFLRHALPYQIVGGTRFYERREIMDVLAYLRLISNPRDGGAFDRIVNYPRRGIGDTSKARLVSWAAERGVAVLDAARSAAECPELTRNAAKALVSFADLIDRYRELARHLGVGEL